ncbi:MAG: biotin carboxylase N-terminal domain-containing protein [Alphaproteobacteria bacterium]|nr:biotin carboxylase N-terminal domain-containing protein [Alphaproteobacteria bacterium]
MPLFQKVLIANRGEIACRIIKTLKKLSIKSVAIYSSADKGALYTELADEAYEIGGPQARDSYLNIEKIVNLAVKIGVDAVHPGFGFLAENPMFAECLDEEDIVFIGPNAHCLRVLGDKIEAKKIAHKLNIPILSGDLEPVSDPMIAALQAEKLGFPVLIKAVAGGGGKGMRRVYAKSDLKDEIGRAMSEAQSSFGDARVFIEKFVERPRHIEIQVLADKHGNAIYLGERECSLQRRYQKVIEEAPSPFVDANLREKLGRDALKIIKETGYFSVGTVEFLVDPDKNHYFLEVNPRLQVEHPVTELVTNIDIVEQMLLVAKGSILKIAQKDVALKGWAIEARICAEDPLRHFMPSIGKIKALQMPEADNIRIDTGIVEGNEISPYYDSMIAKAIAYGETRDEAIQTLVSYLDSCVIKGLDHNIPFLQSLLLNSNFQQGDFSTRLIEETYPDAFSYQKPDENFAKLLYKIGCFYQFLTSEKHDANARAQSIWSVTIGTISHKIIVTPTSDNSADIWYEMGDAAQSGIESITMKIYPNLSFVEVNTANERYFLHVNRQGYNLSFIWRDQKCVAEIVPFHIADLLKHMPVKKADDHSQYVVSPMPGLLLSLKVAEGDFVKSGEALAVIEAMKMENVVRAHREGKIIKLHVKPGQSLKAEQPMIEFEIVA